MQAIGQVGEDVLFVVYTDRNARHIISARLASREGAKIMALVRRTMENIRRLKPRINRAKIDATTEADIRRHMREEDQDETVLGWCPAEWCNSGVAVVIAGGHGRCCQVATAGNLTIGSSLKGAIVSRLM
jgi:hypothetical protein